MEDTGRDLVENELLVAYMNGVAGIGPALVPGDDVHISSEDIDDLPFAFITPLTTYDYRAASWVPGATHWARSSVDCVQDNDGEGLKTRRMGARKEPVPRGGTGPESCILQGS